MSRERELPYLADRPHLAIPVARDRTGRTGPTKAEAAGPHWRRVSLGRYLQMEAPWTTEQRILSAACLLPSYGGVTGWASLNWQGGTRWFGGSTASGDELPVWLAVGGDDIRPQPGVRISAERLDPLDLVTVDGVSLTTATRSTLFEMRYAANVRRAAAVLSMAAYHDLVSVDELSDYAARHSGWTGIPQARAALPLAEENCWSPPEVETVLVWRLDAELPRPLSNAPIFDRAGNHVGTPDLLDVEAGVVGQYHGSLHLEGFQLDTDTQAEERFRRLGLECFTVRNTHLRAPGALAERMHAVRSRARWEAESRRAWTIVHPPWWTPTHTVELRRALDPQERRRWLRYRAA